MVLIDDHAGLAGIAVEVQASPGAPWIPGGCYRNWTRVKPGCSDMAVLTRTARAGSRPRAWMTRHRTFTITVTDSGTPVRESLSAKFTITITK